MLWLRYSMKTALFRARARSLITKWRSLSEKFWNSMTRSYHSVNQASGTPKQSSELWSHSLKNLSVQQCLKRSEICSQVWLASSTKASANSDLVLTNWKQMLSTLLNNSRIKRSLHWNIRSSQKKSKFKSSFQVLVTISRTKMRSSKISRATKSAKLTLLMNNFKRT
jgi:hypothetical protein